jgi:hypothetical protein
MLSWKERFRALATMLVRPRTTMRRILDQPPDRMIVPLILLAVFSGFLKDLTSTTLRLALQVPSVWLVLGIVVAVFVVVSLLMILFVHALSWVAMLIGRFLEGSGTASEVRSALAWGLVPIVWALLIRLPLYLILPPPDESAAGVQVVQNRLRIDPGSLTGAGCGAVVLYALLDLLVLVVYFIIASQALGEAHRFSGWRGFATLLLSFVTPAVVLLAAGLAVLT